MPTLLLSLLLSADPLLQRALDRAVAVPGARVELLAFRAPACRGAWEVPPISASGRVPVRARAPGCDEWSWARVRVRAPGAVLTADVAAGEPLAGRWSTQQLEVRQGRAFLTAIDPAATAARSLRSGTPLSPSSVRLGPAPGTPVAIRVIAGGLVVEQRGTATPCTPGFTCASLPSGRRVRGLWAEGALVVSAEGGP